MSLPFRPIHFDADGDLVRETPAAFSQWLADQHITDLFVFSHGWNNDESTAMKLYNGFFGAMSDVLDAPGLARKRSDAVIGTAGVIWPSILWPDEVPQTSTGGGAASFNTTAEPEPDLFGDLKKVFVLPDQQAQLDQLKALLDSRPHDDAALKQFKAGVSRLLAPPDAAPPQDNLEKRGLADNNDDYRDIFDALADDESSDNSDGGGAAGFDIFERLWNGAKGALRVASYYQMKDRAGMVGEKGLGPLLAPLNVRIYLIGHSFGARLVSHTLKPLPAGKARMLLLLQGAFSHFSFAKQLPFDKSRSGDLAGVDAKVDGPLITTHSLLDSAVGRAYPLASIVARQDASAATDADYRWGAMGHDGAQCVNARNLALNAPHDQFSFSPGTWLNLDGNRVIVNGGPPSGAHSDIIHPEIAWVTLAGAGIV